MAARQVAHGYVICHKDKFWGGDTEALDENDFDSLANVSCFEDESVAGYALETLNVDESMRSECEIVPVVITVGL